MKAHIHTCRPLRTPKRTTITKMAGVTQAKPWFTEAGFYNPDNGASCDAVVRQVSTLLGRKNVKLEDQERPKGTAAGAGAPKRLCGASLQGDQGQ